MPLPLNPAPEFEAELSRRTLMSEQRRARILAGVLGAIALIIGLYAVTIGRHETAMPVYGWIIAIALISCAYEWWVSSVAAHLIRKGVQPTRFRFYINAVIELSVPTVATWISAQYLPVDNAINGPATYAYFLFIILSALRLDFGLSLFTGAVAALGYTAVGMLYWPELEAEWGGPHSGWRFGFFMRAVMFLIGGLVAGLVSMRIRTTLLETTAALQERERIVDLFGQHVSPSVVNQLLTQPTGEASALRHVCIMVLDVRNFTSYSEDRAADEVVAYLNTLWGFMVRTVNEHHGIVNKFLGDGFLAVFGAPISVGNDCANAIAASRHILRELDELAADERLPRTHIGIALHAGEAIVGNVGSAERKEYTVIGDVVNVAFRIEALNKNFGSKLLISDPVRQAGGMNGGEQLQPISVRGRREAVELYRLA